MSLYDTDDDNVTMCSPMVMITLSPDPGTAAVFEESLNMIDFIFNCCLTQVVSELAFCGTAVNVALLLSFDLSSDSSAILLLALSFVDLIFCFTLPFRRCQCIVTRLVGPAEGINVDSYMALTIFAVNRMFLCISLTMIGVIATERFIAVYWPFRAQSLLSTRNFKIAVYFAYMANILLLIPGFHVYKIECVFTEEFNQSVALLGLSEFYISNYETLNFLFAIVYNTCLLGASMLCTILFTPAIAMKLWKVTKKRRLLVQSSKEVRFDTQLAKVLFIICLVSLILHGPGIIFDTVAFFFLQFY